MSALEKPPRQNRPEPNRARLVKAAWILFAAGIIALLFFVPYDVLRTERLRAFGEVETQGLVKEKTRAQDQDGRILFQVSFLYEDGSGFIRQAEALFPESVFKALKIGKTIIVYYAKADPTIVRAESQIEPWLQGSLRQFLGP